MTITETNSFSWVIRDVFFDALKTTLFFSGFTCRKSRMLQVQPQDLPFLGVYFVGEEMGPDGTPNHGYIRFTHTLRIGFSVVIANNDPVVCENKLDQSFWAIMNRLWRDPYLMNMIDTRAYPGGVGNPDNTRIESIIGGTRHHHYGSTGLNNEMPIGEMRYEARCVFRAGYPPIITDDFLLMHLETGVKPGETEEEMAKRHQVKAVYEFDVSK